MDDFMMQKVECACARDIVSAKNAIVVTLPVDIRKQFSRIFTAYLAGYGMEGAYERMNNHTLAEIFAEYNAANDPKPIASGEVDGVRYKLFAPPAANQERGET